MGKGDRKTRAKRNQAKFGEVATLPSLKSVPRPKKRGRARMQEIERDPDAPRAALSARARHMGRDHTDASVRSEMRTEALGEAAGRAIHLSGHKEPDKLWAAYRGLTGAEAAYARVSLGMSLHAKTAKIEMMPERMETRADDKPDLRSEDERHRDAVNTWMRWQGYMGHLLSSEQSAIWAIVRDRADPVAKTANGGAVLTRAGRDFVDAMASLSEVLERSSGTR